MEFKFKIGDKVYIKYTDMFSTLFGAPGFGAPSPALGGVITDRRVHRDGKNQYMIKGFTGWWDEVTLKEVKE